MIWNVLLAVGVAVIVLCVVKHARDKPYPHNGDWGFAAGMLGIPVGVLFILSVVFTAVNENEVSVYRRSGELVELKISQRDALANLVRDEMSLEQYEAVMAATPDTDILIILGNNAALFLVEKTRLLVTINTELNTLVNGLARDRINLCAWADNPLTPRLFISPDCPDPIELPR